MLDPDSPDTLQDNLPEPADPDALLREFRERGEALDRRLDGLQELIHSIRSEIRSESSQTLTRLAQAATDMANGRVYQRIDMEAKGELGTLVASLNQTLQNLQQLDTSIKHQSTQVPELAAQLDAITADTETATQNVMNRLDALMNTAEDGKKSTEALVDAFKAVQDTHHRFQARIDEHLARAANGEDPARVAQDLLEFLFEHQTTTRPPTLDLAPILGHFQAISDDSYEILNILQFQDITRQKVEKVIQLLKQFKTSLTRLLEIFHITTDEGAAGTDAVFAQRTIGTQENIFDTSLTADHKKDSVEDIIAQFRQQQG